MKNAIKRIVQGVRGGGARLRARCRALTVESGNALIETAVGVGVCTTLIIGASELGRIAYAAIEVSNAAHAGAQYGAQSRTYAADVANINTAAQQDAPDISGISATSSYSCKCSDGSASTCLPTDCSASRIITYVQVNTTATVNPQIYLPGLPRSYTLTGQAVMRVSQ